MCGIIGHVGHLNTAQVIIDGLARLEYRGYDSTGICLKSPTGKLLQYKKAGKLKNLLAILPPQQLVSHIGIGHTRWATHGAVSDLNAHPHGHQDLSIVHNGIIENAQELTQQLTQEGWNFQSQTDSEIFLALTSKYLAQQPLELAVAAAFRQIEGNSAFVAMERASDKIVAIKRGAPLACGQNAATDNLFVCSDPYALIGHAQEVFFPADEVLCILDPTSPGSKPSLHFLELDQSPSSRVLRQQQHPQLKPSEKGHFDHYMLKEIHQQPELIRKFTHYYLNGDGRLALQQVAPLRPRLIHLAACGTAWHAGLCIKNMIEKNNHIPVHVELASEFRYHSPLLTPQDLGVFLSQSGETADTLAAQKLCHQQGLTTLAIVNTQGSTLFRESTHNLLIQAEAEVAVASTKAFTLMVLTGHLFSQQLSGNSLEPLRPEIDLLADRIESLLASRQQLQQVAQEIYQKKGFLYTGRGPYFPIALEGALKLKEISYVHAEGYAAGELKHGPIALIDQEMVNIALVGPEHYAKSLSNLEEVRARGGVIVAIGHDQSQHLAQTSDYFLPLDFSQLPNLGPLLANVVTQLLAYDIARCKGTDIDRPRNLAKSVTVE